MAKNEKIFIWNVEESTTKIAQILGTTIALAFLGFIFAILIMYSWNAVIPKIFNLPQIGYWDSFSLYILITFISKAAK